MTDKQKEVVIYENGDYRRLTLLGGYSMKKLTVLTMFCVLACGGAKETQEIQEAYTVPDQQPCESFITDLDFLGSYSTTYGSYQTTLEFKADGSFTYVDDGGGGARGIYGCFTEETGSFIAYATDSNVYSNMPIAKYTCDYEFTVTNRNELDLDCDVLTPEGETGFLIETFIN